MSHRVDLMTEDRFRRIADVMLGASRADDTFVRLSDSRDATLRFANNQVVQNVSVHEPSVSVRVAFGKKVGRASTTQFDRASLMEAVSKAEELAMLAPDNPEFLPSLPPQRYGSFPTLVKATANAKPMHVAKRVAPVIELCDEAGLVGAGILSNGASAVGLAASSGLFAFEHESSATFSLTATAADSSGWTMNRHRDINKLDTINRSQVAVDKAIASKSPREIEPGHYTVILEPSATAGLLGPVTWSFGAKSYHRGTSAFSGKLGTVILDPRLTLRSQPDHPDLMGSRFAGDGMAMKPQTWIENGVLKQLQYDRFTAREHGVEPNPGPSALTLDFSGDRAPGIDDLVRQTDRGVLITNLWYIRYVDSTDLTVTGMTRDGTFLIENGRIVGGLRNFRFHDSPLRVFQTIDAATGPLEASSMERGKMLLPAIKAPDFHLSSVTRF